MILKIFRGVWFLSMMAVLANFLYNYAGLGEEVVVFENGLETISIGKETFFYAGLACITVFNTLAFAFGKSIGKDELFCSWFHGLIITLNIFFIIGFSYLSLYNSTEKFDYGRIGIIVYSSVILIAVWAAGWPVIAVLRKSFF